MNNHPRWSPEYALEGLQERIDKIVNAVAIRKQVEEEKKIAYKVKRYLT